MITRHTLKSTGVALIVAAMLPLALVLLLPGSGDSSSAQEPAPTLTGHPMPFAGDQYQIPITSTLVANNPDVTTPLANGNEPLAFQRGDVFVAVAQGQVQWRRANGALVQTLNTGVSSYTTGMAFHPSTYNLYVTGFDANRVSVFNTNGNLVGTFGSGYNSSPESILFDASRNVYVGHAGGTRDIYKFNEAGNLIRTFDVATENVGSDWIDLSSDQCTMYYTSEGRTIKRYNVCTQTQLSNFSTALHGEGFALRLLPGGGLLVADRSDIHRLNASGQIVQTYDASGQDCWFALNLDPDGSSFWSADFCSSAVYKFDIASGAQLLTFNTGTATRTVYGLAVMGEITVVQPTATPTATPTRITPPPSGTPTATPPLATPTATPDFPVCTLSVDKIAYPSTARIDGQVGVTLRLTGDCPGEIGAAVDVALVIDRSQSMCGPKLTQAQAAGQAFLDNMALPPDQASVISFAGTANLHTGLTTNRTQAINALYNMTCGGISRLDAGLNLAFDEMTGPRRVAGHTPAVILLTDGNPQGSYADDVRTAARRVRDAGIQLYTVGLGADVNTALLREIATSPDRYYQSPTPADLAQIYSRLAGELRQAPGFNVNLTDVVASQFEIVPGSFSGAATPQVNGQTLNWYLARIEEGVTEVNFAVHPRQCGTFPVNQSATVSYDDNRGGRHSLAFPVPTVTVDGCSGALTDIFVQDNQLDTGTVPSDPPWWDSPDIWVRHTADGGMQHQNPQAGQRNYLYARVRNRGTTTVTNIDVTMYYGASGLGLSWPAAWTQIPGTRRIASLAPGAVGIVSMPWDVPNLAGHFCLRLHVSAAQDPLLDYRVAWENNIAQRNLHIVAFPQPPTGACTFDQNGMMTDTVAFDVINTLNTSSLVDLRVTASDLPSQATAWLVMGALHGRWSSLDGLTVEADQRLRITRFPAMIYGVRLNPQESRQVQMQVSAPVNSRFTVSLAELVRGNLVGGNSYQRWMPPCPLSLPLVLKGQRCTGGGTYVPPDVILVLDRSGSMADEGKLVAAKAATRTFLSHMDLSVEQAGIASFATTASLNQQLTRNRSALDAAINGLVASGSTAIGDGIAVAQAELESPRHINGHTRAIVLLSDGDNNSGQDPVAAANRAKQHGTVIFTIGLGSYANGSLLRQLASQASNYFYAPTPAQLEEIYIAIAGEVGCQR